MDALHCGISLSVTAPIEELFLGRVMAEYQLQGQNAVMGLI